MLLFILQPCFFPSFMVVLLAQFPVYGLISTLFLGETDFLTEICISATYLVPQLKSYQNCMLCLSFTYFIAINYSTNIQVQMRACKVNGTNKQTQTKSGGAMEEEGDIECEYEQIIINSLTLAIVKKQDMGHPIHKNTASIIWPTKNNQFGRGSGLLISRNLVLTCAHILYQSGNRVDNSIISIYPGQCGKLERAYKVKACYIPEQYEKLPKNKVAQYEYALLKLTEKVPSDSFLPLDGYFKNNGQKLAIFGYPHTAYRNTGGHQNIEEVQQWGLILDNSIVEINQTQGIVLHQISTLGGQSGSPIIDVSQQVPCVIGIHRGSKTQANGEQLNKGKLLSQELISKLAEKARQMKAEMFSFYQLTETVIEFENQKLKKLKEGLAVAQKEFQQLEVKYNTCYINHGSNSFRTASKRIQIKVAKKLQTDEV